MQPLNIFTVGAQQMHEPAMALDRLVLSPQKEVVRAFYKDMWDQADKRLIPKIFHQDFTFRGSLGPELVGHEQFAGYVDRVTNVFGQYTTDILAMIKKATGSAEKCAFTAITSRKSLVLNRVAATCGGSACRFSHSMGRRCATSTSSAISTG